MKGMNVQKCTLCVCVLTLILVCVLVFRSTRENFVAASGANVEPVVGTPGVPGAQGAVFTNGPQSLLVGDPSSVSVAQVGGSVGSGTPNQGAFRYSKASPVFTREGIIPSTEPSAGSSTNNKPNCTQHKTKDTCKGDCSWDETVVGTNGLGMCKLSNPEPVLAAESLDPFGP